MFNQNRKLGIEATLKILVKLYLIAQPMYKVNDTQLNPVVKPIFGSFSHDNVQFKVISR